MEDHLKVEDWQIEPQEEVKLLKELRAQSVNMNPELWDKPVKYTDDDGKPDMSNWDNRKRFGIYP